MKEAEHKKRATEHKQDTLAQVFDEACRSIPDFDMQDEEELEQRIVKLKDYAQ